MSSKKADYVLVGGGSGGHIVPLLPVAESIHKKDPEAVVVHVGHKNDPINQITKESSEIAAVYEVSAGKLRRYHGESWLKRLFDVKTLYFNVRDFFRFVIGIVQAWVLLRKIKPKAIFMKGGYVCANVGIAARMQRIPYITHDSDAMVSLAHRVIAKHAVAHTTAMPPEHYAQFDQSKTVQVGVPIRSVFAPHTAKDQADAKQQLNLPKNAKVILVTGGGLGAQNINDAVLQSAGSFMKDPDVFVVLVSGSKLYKNAMKQYETLPEDVQNRMRIESFTNNMHAYSTASEIIITRASATALSEFAAQSKACIIVPNPLLAGGHQLKNAKALEASHAVKVVPEDKVATGLPSAVRELLADKKERVRLGKALQEAVIPGASDRIATMLIEIGSHR